MIVNTSPTIKYNVSMCKRLSVLSMSPLVKWLALWFCDQQIRIQLETVKSVSSGGNPL